MPDFLSLGTTTALRPWWPTELESFVGATGYADLRFTMPDLTSRTVIRMLSNKDVRFYGDVHLTNTGDDRARYTASGLEYYGQGTLAPKELILKVNLEADGVSDLWGILRAEVDGGLRQLQVTEHVRFEAQNNGAWRDWAFWVCKFHIRLMCEDGEFLIMNAEGDPLFVIQDEGGLFLTAPDGFSAKVAIDSTAAGGKSWHLVSEESDGSLRIINATDEGAPRLEVSPSGSLYATEFLGMTPVSAAPSDSVGRVGAVAIDTTNNRIWVKVTNTGTNRWRYATLASI